MGQFYSKGLCPQCHKATLTIWPEIPGQARRKTCSDPACHYKEG